MDTRVLASGVGFTEGPVITQFDAVVFTSIDQGCVYRTRGDETTVLAVTGGGPNGAAEGAGGLFFISQNGGRQPAHRWPYVTGGVQIVHPGGRVDWLTQDLVSPSDICLGPDGCLYVTDPTRRAARDDGRLWRCDSLTGEAELLASVPWYPNGIGFGREDDAVYVASTGQRRIWRFPLDHGRVGKPEMFIQMARGLPDGFAFDIAANMVIAAVGTEGNPGEVQTYDRDGHFLDRFAPGTSIKYTNVALSAAQKLIITDADKGHVLEVSGWPYAGLALHPFRASGLDHEG
jgi:gluconolactonase